MLKNVRPSWSIWLSWTNKPNHSYWWLFPHRNPRYFIRGFRFPVLGQQVLNVGAWSWELEIRRKAAGKRHFLVTQLLQCCSAVFACCSAAFGQNDIRPAAKRMLHCNFCSATFRKLQCNFCFRLWHVAGVGFRGVGFRICWLGRRAPSRGHKRSCCLGPCMVKRNAFKKCIASVLAI